MRKALLDRLLDPNAVVIFDGAMGSMLYAKGFFINLCYDELNLRSPDLVRDVHVAYVNAGAEVLETNSFGANRLKLSQYGLQDQVREINVSAASLARSAAGDAVLVAGAVGPLGVRLEPYGSTSKDEAFEIFVEQMEGLKEGGVDLFLLETFGDIDEIEQAVRAARKVDPELPVIAQMTVNVDGVTPYGATPADVAKALDSFGADVIGLNCSVGPQIILDAIEKMAAVTNKKLSAQPNAGMPRDVGGRTMYMASPEYMATYARHLVLAGAKIVGGCCGTTPEHIRDMVEGVRPLSPKTASLAFVKKAAGDANAAATGSQEATSGAAGVSSTAGISVDGVAKSVGEGAVSNGSTGSSASTGNSANVGSGFGIAAKTNGVPSVPFEQRSRLAAKLANSEFVTSVEIVPPKGVDATRMLEDARVLKAAGVDAINVPDGPRAQSRMGAVLTSVLIEQQAGIEAVTHYCCRDRNLLGMLSDLLGASAIGLRNLLLITGDPPKMGPYPTATAVFDIDSIGLTNLVSNLNRGLDPGDNPIGVPTKFVVGVGVNPVAIDPATELKRFEWKVQAGAEYAITQPVFDVNQLERFLESIEHTRIPVVAGIWPLVSARNAEFLANEVPGVTVPEAVISRMREANAKSKEHAIREGIDIAREMLERVKPYVQGVQVSAPFGKVSLALDVFDGIAL